MENPRREIDSSRKNSCKFRRALRLWGGKKGNRGDKNEKEGGVVRGGGGWRWQKGRNASDGAWIKRERKLIEPRGNYELRWPRLIHFRFVQRFPRLAPTLLVTVHDGRAPDTRVYYPFPPCFGFAPFLSVSLFVEPSPTPLLLAEGNRQRVAEKEARRRKNYRETG